MIRSALRLLSKRDAAAEFPMSKRDAFSARVGRASMRRFAGYAPLRHDSTLEQRGFETPVPARRGLLSEQQRLRAGTVWNRIRSREGPRVRILFPPPMRARVRVPALFAALVATESAKTVA